MASTHAHARSAWSGKWAFILCGGVRPWAWEHVALPIWRPNAAAARSCSPTWCWCSRSAYRCCCWRRRSAARRASPPSARSSSSASSTPSSASWRPPCPFIITPYYCIIGGWVTVRGGLPDQRPGGAGRRRRLLHRLHLQQHGNFLWMLLFMAIVFIVVSLGVKRHRRRTSS